MSHPLDLEMTRIVEKELIDNGIKLTLRAAVEKIEGNDFIKIHLKSGQVIEVDIALFAVGIRPETTLAKDAAWKLGHGVVLELMNI